MKKILFKILLAVLVLCSAVPVLCITSSALSWDGSSDGGGGNANAAGANGYAIRTDEDNCIGYRFSVVDKSGANKVSTVIDVFRNTYYGNNGYSNTYKFSAKYNKKQLIAKQNSGFSTVSTSTNCYKEASMGFVTSFPAPSGMGVWQNYTGNLNAVLSHLGAGTIANLKNGDKILVEPLYDIRLQSVWHSVTVSEIALYGKYILGAYSNGGWSYTSESWGFIAPYTNMHYPNSLYTPDGQGLWTGVASLSSQATFYTMLNSGYGVGIAYTETKPDFSPNLNIGYCEVWDGALSTRGTKYGISNGSSFNDYIYVNGYPTLWNTVWFTVNFPAESQNCRVRQTVWSAGDSASRTVYSNSGTWYDVALNPTQVYQGRWYYIINARVDYIDSAGNVLKYGTAKTFYFPIKPKIDRNLVAMYSVTGEASAYNGTVGNYGCVYVGQRVHTKYTFTSDNTWTSLNNFYTSRFDWKNGAWAETPENTAYNVPINNTGEYTTDSPTALYTVPDSTLSDGTQKNIAFRLRSQWSTAAENTTENRWLELHVIKADAELESIRLIDETGYYLDTDSLEAGQTVTVQYTYKNNTACTIYVNGFADGGSQIEGIYAIPAGESINVNGGSFEVPNTRVFSIWGGVFLENAGIHNTAYETDGTNNELSLECHVNHPLYIRPVSPNASYREGTEVISSFWIFNAYHDSYIPTDEISVHFLIADESGNKITVLTKDGIVVPEHNKNLVYVKWTVPNGLNGKKIKITASIVEDGAFFNPVTKAYSTVPYVISETPDTEFESSAPDGFTAQAVPSAAAGNATWWEYTYSNGAFSKVNYGIGIYNGNDIGTTAITPATGETAISEGGKWTMKSGYGISVDAFDALAYIKGYEYPSELAYSRIQYVTALFPEFRYSKSAGMFRTLEKHGAYWQFRQNAEYGKVHFIPLWYPDGDYTVSVVKSDCWTPAGMLSASVVTNTIKISGSAYDDWFVGRK